MKHASAVDKNAATPFISDVKTLRERARHHIEQGAVVVSIIFGEHHGRSRSQIDNPSYKSD